MSNMNCKSVPPKSTTTKRFGLEQENIEVLSSVVPGSKLHQFI